VPVVRLDREMVKIAVKPLPLLAVSSIPSDLVPSKNSTEPAGLAVPTAGVTLAVNVTASP
jgi:hypothetical protein